MASCGLTTFMWLILLTASVHGFRHGGHHGGSQPDNYSPPPGHSPPEDSRMHGERDSSCDEDDEDNDHGHNNSHTLMAGACVLAGLLVLFVIVAMALYWYKRTQLRNKIGLGSRKTAVSVISSAPPPYEPRKTIEKTVSPVEATAPPGYSYVELLPPRTPPPPYEINDRKPSHKI